MTNKYGDVGKKIHTARSRNDQVLVAIRLYEKEKINEIIMKVPDLEDTEELQKASRQIRDLIESQKLPTEMEEEILESYKILK